jgi:hypothetical protein
MVIDMLLKQVQLLKQGKISFYNSAFNVYRDYMFWNHYLEYELN